MGVWSIKNKCHHQTVLSGARMSWTEPMFPSPFPEEKLEPVEWKHVLATLDVCTLRHGIKFCDEDGYDIVPIRMLKVIETHDDPTQAPTVEHLSLDEVFIEDITTSRAGTADDELEENDENISESNEDFEVPESELGKVRILLRGREEIHLEIPKAEPNRKFCHSHKKF